MFNRLMVFCGLLLTPAIGTAASISIGSFVPGIPDVSYDVAGPLVDFGQEEVTMMFALPIGLDPITPGIRSVILLNRPGGPSGPVGEPSDFLTITVEAPVLDSGTLVQFIQLLFLSEGAVGFGLTVLGVQATGAPEVFATGAFQDLSSLLDTAGVLSIQVGSESAAIPEPGTLTLLAGGLFSAIALKLARRLRYDEDAPLVRRRVSGEFDPS